MHLCDYDLYMMLHTEPKEIEEEEEKSGKKNQTNPKHQQLLHLAMRCQHCRLVASSGSSSLPVPRLNLAEERGYKNMSGAFLHLSIRSPHSQAEQTQLFQLLFTCVINTKIFCITLATVWIGKYYSFIRETWEIPETSRTCWELKSHLFNAASPKFTIT